MNIASRWHVISTGLAIFSMFFGAGNLMYPIMVGVSSGQHTIAGLLGFLITAVLLPLAGLIAMILFDGDYERFFKRLGNVPGSLLIVACMIIIGPLIAIPRITTLSHIMIAPFIPWDLLKTITPLSSGIFALMFLGITFLATYRENKIVDLLGTIVSPLLLISLTIIIIKGFFTGHVSTTTTDTPWHIFSLNFMRGYETLDLLGGIFFASIVIKILKQTSEPNLKKLALIGLRAGLLGVTLLALVYIGMSYLGAFYGYGLEGNAGELFREISYRILGGHGAAIIATAVLMACLSTSIALGAVVAEYTQQVIFGNRIGFITALALVMLASLPLSVYGLSTVLQLTGGAITYIGYPVLIALTLANITYKLCGFKPIVLPVLITFIISLITYWV
jgi:branched-chain amino acid:cation transporter, LIVCS family